MTTTTAAHPQEQLERFAGNIEDLADKLGAAARLYVFEPSAKQEHRIADLLSRLSYYRSAFDRTSS